MIGARSTPSLGPTFGQSALVFGIAFLLFATSATTFVARVTDLSALRVLAGEVPYRDFWTMYAPGSFVTLAGVFALLGPQLILSNVLGLLTSAVAVAMLQRLAHLVCGSGLSWVVAALTAVALYGVGYHNGFTSYPPALLLLLAAAWLAATRCVRPGWRWAAAPGFLLGTAMLYKHDVASYAAIGIAVATAVSRIQAGVMPVLSPVVAMAAFATLLPAVVAGVLTGLGAGPEMWRDLVVFPLTDFRYVRPEYFPLVPQLRPSALETVQEIVHWGTCNVPTAALAVGLVALWRHRTSVDPGTTFVVALATVAFLFHWWAAHVQLNTHAISLTLWGSLVAGAGLAKQPAFRQARWRVIAAVCIVGWGMLFLARPVYNLATESAQRVEWIDLPRLRGIRVSSDRAIWMRQLAGAIRDAGDSDAGLLLLSQRNDVTVYADSEPFWLSERPSATRYHELHPGITDTELVQREMLADLARQPLPVVVREQRFGDSELDEVKATMRRHVAVGSTLIDDWVAANYVRGQRFGQYEVMRQVPR